ncbi:hypothetical protein GCM10027184_69780 [Saccharothrix stipae]
MWQREVAERLVAGHGVIVAEYFEAGCTRLKEWADRPKASRLLAALADPDRGFDAIVVGEYERGFDRADPGGQRGTAASTPRGSRPVQPRRSAVPPSPRLSPGNPREGHGAAFPGCRTVERVRVRDHPVVVACDGSAASGARGHNSGIEPVRCGLRWSRQADRGSGSTDAARESLFAIGTALHSHAWWRLELGGDDGETTKGA